jgi:hypothetical protein
MHKTATTFLQEEVFPKIVMANPSVNFIDTFSIDMDIQEGKINIISDENLDGGSYRLFRNHVHRDRIIRNLYRMFPKAKVILCIRDRDKWLTSAYKQFVVGYGWNGSFSDYKSFMDPEVLNFEGYVSEVKNYYPSAKIMRFEDLVLNSETFVSNICQFIGCKQPDNINYEKKNVAITDNQVMLIRIIGKILPLKELYFPISVAIKILRKDVKFGEWGRKI